MALRGRADDYRLEGCKFGSHWEHWQFYFLRAFCIIH